MVNHIDHMHKLFEICVFYVIESMQWKETQSNLFKNILNRLLNLYENDMQNAIKYYPNLNPIPTKLLIYAQIIY